MCFVPFQMSGSKTVRSFVRNKNKTARRRLYPSRNGPTHIVPANDGSILVWKGDFNAVLRPLLNRFEPITSRNETSAYVLEACSHPATIEPIAVPFAVSPSGSGSGSGSDDGLVLTPAYLWRDIFFLISHDLSSIDVVGARKLAVDSPSYKFMIESSKQAATKEAAISAKSRVASSLTLVCIRGIPILPDALMSEKMHMARAMLQRKSDGDEPLLEGRFRSPF